MTGLTFSPSALAESVLGRAIKSTAAGKESARADANLLERVIEGGIMQGESPARLYALVVGAPLVLAGVLGFLYESTFTSDESST